MYLELVNTQINNDFGIIHYSNLNEVNQINANRLFHHENNLHESYLLCKTNGDSVLFLGYFILDNTHITSSTQFDVLQHNTINYYNVDYLPLIQNERCVHIHTWVFDVQLGNVQGIKRVFSYITNITDNRPYILWCEIDNNLLFYRVEDGIYGHTMAVNYFSKNFSMR